MGMGGLYNSKPVNDYSPLTPQAGTAFDQRQKDHLVFEQRKNPTKIKVEDICQMEELKTLGPKRNLAEELYSRIGPFDFDRNQPRNFQQSPNSNIQDS